MKNKKEIVILSLIFIAIIACIVLLIVFLGNTVGGRLYSLIEEKFF